MIARVVATVALVALLVAACSSPPTPVVCKDIPSGGCPQDNGADPCQDTCDCRAVYDCADGKWVFDRACPAEAPDACAAVQADASDAPNEGATRDVGIDAPPGSFGGPGCTDLEVPDCSLGTALLCMGATDCCGCQDLWICQGGGWVPWGVCGDAGAVPSTGK